MLESDPGLRNSELGTRNSSLGRSPGLRLGGTETIRNVKLPREKTKRSPLRLEVESCLKP